MPLHPVNSAFLLAMSGCTPRYFNKGPMEPSQLWAPLPVQHVMVDMPDVGAVDVAYIDSGPRDGTPMVFMHGLSSYLGFWEYQVPHFAEGHRVLALDLPGYGASARPDAPCTPPWYSDLVSAWMDALDIDGAVVVGHSMGGQIALTMAVDHPDKVERLVLSAPAGFERFDAGAARWMKDYWHEARALEAREEEMRATFSTLVFNRMDDGVERLLEERVRMGQTASFRGTSVAVARSVAGMVDHPLLGPPGDPGRLAAIQVPTLIVFGTDDRMIPNPVFTGGRTRAVAETGLSSIDRARLVMIPKAGHTVHHDAPKAFNAAVDEFLAGATP